MQASHEFLTNLALVLCIAGVTTLVFQRLHQPVVFGYLLAGLIVGPHTPIPLVADEEIVHTLAELGMILLMFSLGLEFSLRKLMKLGPRAGAIALGQSSLMLSLGYLVGQAFGWTTIESVYAGGIIAISSTTIILKAFSEQRVKARFTRLVFGVLIVQDLIAIFLLTILTTISSGQSLTVGTLAITAGKLVGFLVGLLGIGLLIVPRLIRLVLRLDVRETTLVTSVGICFACALLALEFGYSVALGAFIGGSLVAESGHAKEIEDLVLPVRDMFGAIFFVAVGMLIDPRLVLDNIGAVVVFTVVVIVGQTLAVSLMALLTGHDLKTSLQTGMSMAQIGEFSFIIASLGLTLGATRNFLYPVAVAVSAITTLSTPWLIRASGPAAEWLDRKLPHTLQTFVALYGSWLERMRQAPPQAAGRSLQRTVLLLAVDCALLIGLVVVTALSLPRFTVIVASFTKLEPASARLIVISVAAAVAAPLFIGVLQMTRVLSRDLSLRAFPSSEPGKVDFAAAPRRVLAVTLHIVLVALSGLPIVVMTQPFLPAFRGTLLLLIVLGVLAVAFWRSAANLQGHARAGAEIIVMALSRQMAPTEEHDEPDVQLERIRQALPGLGEPIAVTLRPGVAGVDRSLASLNLRGMTGATVLAIARAGQDVLLPTGRETLKDGDVLFLAGTHKAVAAARTILLRREGSETESESESESESEK